MLPPPRAIVEIVLQKPVHLSRYENFPLRTRPGMSYLALYVMQREKMLERRTRENDGEPAVSWIVSAIGTVLSDGILPGNIDIAGTGIPAFVALWAKGRGLVDIKGIAAYGSRHGVLISRNPAVRSVRDFTAALDDAITLIYTEPRCRGLPGARPRESRRSRGGDDHTRPQR